MTGWECLSLDGESTRLLDAWRERDRAVIIDAVVSDSPAGFIHHLQLGRDELPAAPKGFSSHRAGVTEAVALAGALDRLPAKLDVFGVEAADLSPGEGLSPAVADALPDDFQLRPRPPQKIKGKPEPVETFKVSRTS